MLLIGTQRYNADEHDKVWYAQYSLSNLEADSDVLKNVTDSDECSLFSSEGVNKQKCWIRGRERPQEVYEVWKRTVSIMVWYTISEKGVIGLYFF